MVTNYTLSTTFLNLWPDVWKCESHRGFIQKAFYPARVIENTYTYMLLCNLQPKIGIWGKCCSDTTFIDWMGTSSRVSQYSWVWLRLRTYCLFWSGVPKTNYWCCQWMFHFCVLDEHFDLMLIIKVLFNMSFLKLLIRKQVYFRHGYHFFGFRWDKRTHPMT